MMDFSFINELFIFCHLSIIGSHMILLSVIPEGMSGSETEFSLDKRLHLIIHHATQSRFQFHYIYSENLVVLLCFMIPDTFSGPESFFAEVARDDS